MFGLFKTKTHQQKVDDTNAVIAEIHDTFFTEVDRLLEFAKELKPAETDKQALLNKQEVLKAFGFTNTREAKEAADEKSRLYEIDKENRVKEALTQAINYFSFKYPLYKFITEESVKAICEKYNLIYAEVSKYIGDVPDKNLKQIQSFNINEQDECYVEQYQSQFSSGKTFIGFEDYKIKLQEAAEYRRYDMSPHRQYAYRKAPLEICAPLKDFDTKDMELKNFKLSKIEIPDPVVLKPVFYKNKKYYLIVTAWGLEAADELVLNPVHN